MSDLPKPIWGYDICNSCGNKLIDGICGLAGVHNTKVVQSFKELNDGAKQDWVKRYGKLTYHAG